MCLDFVRFGDYISLTFLVRGMYFLWVIIFRLLDLGARYVHFFVRPCRIFRLVRLDSILYFFLFLIRSDLLCFCYFIVLGL